MKVFNFVAFMAFVYLSLAVAIINGFGITQVVEPVSAQVAGVSTVLPTVRATGVPIIDMINEVRRQSGVAPLTLNFELNQITSARSDDMITNEYYAHINKSGRDYSSLLSTQKSYSCENLDLSSSNDPKDIIQDWLNSDQGHRECLLTPRANKVGVSLEEYGTSNDSDKPTYLTVLILSN